MAFPTTLALITALWAGPRTRRRSRCGPRSAADCRRSALVAGGLLEKFWWGSVFLVTLPLAAIALVLAVVLVPSHVSETSDPVDNLGGIVSAVFVGALIVSINFASVPNEAVAIGLGAIAVAAGIAFFIRQRRAESSGDLHAAARIFWVAAWRASSCSARSWPPCSSVSSSCRTCSATRRWRPAPPSSPPFSSWFSSRQGRRSSSSAGARFTLLLGYVFVLLGFLTMFALWDEGTSYWEVGLAYGFVGIGWASPGRRHRTRSPGRCR